MKTGRNKRRKEREKDGYLQSLATIVSRDTKVGQFKNLSSEKAQDDSLDENILRLLERNRSLLTYESRWKRKTKQEQ